MTGLFWAAGVHDIKQKGRANPLKNQGLKPIVPAVSRPQPRVDWGFQAKEKARRFSGPSYMVGWGQLNDACKYMI